MCLVVAGAIAAETSTHLVSARALAHNFGRRVVAESVEAEAILNYQPAVPAGMRPGTGRSVLQGGTADDLTAWIDSQLWRDQVKVACRI